MSTLHSVLFGMGMLILLYLALRNASGVAAIFNAGGPQVINGVKALQGR